MAFVLLLSQLIRVNSKHELINKFHFEWQLLSLNATENLS